MFGQLLVLGSLGLVLAQDVTITQPTTEHWWVAQSDNTISWTGTANHPTTFSVFLANPDEKVLTSKLALISVEQYYEMSKTVNPGSVTPSTGYTIQFTDTLNSSNIYATSESFEIKAVHSAYPPQNNVASPSDSSASASGGSSSASASGTAPSASQSGAASRVLTGSLGLVLAGVGVHALV